MKLLCGTCMNKMFDKSHSQLLQKSIMRKTVMGAKSMEDALHGHVLKHQHSNIILGYISAVSPCALEPVWNWPSVSA